jgi:hypothetical protein
MKIFLVLIGLAIFLAIGIYPTQYCSQDSSRIEITRAFKLAGC